MKKQDSLLLMIAICGELPARLTGQVVGSDSYAAALITTLKRDGFISLRNKDSCRGYVLKAKGRRYVLEHYEDAAAFFLQGSSAHVKSEIEKRLRLHRMSEIWVFFWKTDVAIFRNQKPPLDERIGKNNQKRAVYYGSLEFKGYSEAIKGSRACGVLLSEHSTYVVYNTMKQRMRWAKKMERSMRAWTERMQMRNGTLTIADALILGTDMTPLQELAESDGGIRKNLFQVDDIYECYYYVPMIPEAMVQLELLLSQQKKMQVYDLMCEILSRRKEKEYAIYDGYDEQGIPVYFCYELELRRLLRVKQEIVWQGRGTIICLDYQKESLRAYFGKEVNIQAIVTKRLREYLQQDTK